MTKNIALAASIMVLATISGQAFAKTITPTASYRAEAIGPSARQVVHAFNAFDAPMATQMAEANAHRYHGGPKSND